MLAFAIPLLCLLVLCLWRLNRAVRGASAHPMQPASAVEASAGPVEAL